MDLEAELLADRSKANIQRIVEHIGADKSRFAELMALVLHGTPRTAELSSWVMTTVCGAHPTLGGPWVAKMLDRMERPGHEGVHRNIIRSLQFTELPKRLHGRIFTKMSAIIPDPRYTIAQRAFAITVAMRMVETYPELSGEMRIILEEVLNPDPGPAIRSRADKSLKKLRKLSGLR